MVFDGHPLRDDMAQQALGPLTIRVSPPGGDADTVIRELIERAENPRDWIVVTSDKALYSYVKTLGATVLRAHEWNQLERRVAPGRPREHAGGSAGEKPERETDVEGWLKKFGRED